MAWRNNGYAQAEAQRQRRRQERTLARCALLARLCNACSSASPRSSDQSKAQMYSPSVMTMAVEDEVGVDCA